MTSSRRTIYCSSLTIIVLVIINTVSIDARRTSGGRSWSSGRSWGRTATPSRTPVHVPRAPVHVPKSYSPPPRQNPSPMQHFPQPHTPHNSGTFHGKDSSHTLIHAEGGGRPRPVNTVNDQKQQSSPHQPSAPYEPAHKATAGHVQSQGPPNSGGAYPSWANPSMGPHGGTNPHAPFPSKPAGPLTSAPYPPTHPAGPISHQPITPVHQTNQNNGMPHGMPMPNTHSNPYSHSNTPNGMPPPPYQPPSSPYPIGHPQGMPMPNAPHVGFGNTAHGGSNVHQPIGTPYNYQPLGSSPMQPHGGMSQPTIVHNHYNSPPIGTPQYPAGHPVYGHQPAYGGAPMGQPFVPGQTLVVLPSQQSQDNGRGMGQILKEALVFSTVNAGVNRLINGPSHHHHDSAPVAQPVAPSTATSSTSTVTNTVIYNNQYGNPVPGPNGISLPGQTTQGAVNPGSPVTYPAGTTSSAANFPTDTSGVPNSSSVNPPNPAVPPSIPHTQYPSEVPSGTPSYPQNPSKPTSGTSQTGIVQGTPVAANNTSNQTEQTPPAQEYQYFISNEELWNLTENLFAKDDMNSSQYITINLQTRSLNPNATDDASGPLLSVRSEAYTIPTIQALRDIFDNYEFDSEKKEIMNSDKRREENVMLDVFLNTNVMTTAMNWLSTKGYVEPDDFEWKDTLRHIWLSKVNGATSGFERIFLAEKYPGPSILGGQNWIYFDREESSGRINYLSYVDRIKISDKATLVKINYKIDDVVKPNTTMLIGTPPELEMALYTICYYARPNDLCTVSLGGEKINVYTHAFRYFGKDLIDLGLMMF